MYIILFFMLQVLFFFVLLYFSDVFDELWDRSSGFDFTDFLIFILSSIFLFVVLFFIFNFNMNILNEYFKVSGVVLIYFILFAYRFEFLARK